MSKRQSRSPAENTNPTEKEPSAVRRYIDAISEQRERIYAVDAEEMIERCDRWDAAVNDHDCKHEIKEMFERAIAAIRLFPTELRDPWSKRLINLKFVHEEFLQRANDFGELARRHIESGRPFVHWLLANSQLPPPPDVCNAFNGMEEQFKSHRKQVHEALLELAVLEGSTCRIEWKKETRELWYRGSMIKKFVNTGDTNQEKVLDAFQEAHWECSVKTPFQKKRTLNETLRTLNESTEKSGLRFRTLGNDRVEWYETTPNTALP